MIDYKFLEFRRFRFGFSKNYNISCFCEIQEQQNKYILYTDYINI